MEKRNKIWRNGDARYNETVGGGRRCFKFKGRTGPALKQHFGGGCGRGANSVPKGEWGKRRV